MKIYVASSWKNDVQPDVVKALRTAGHEVYDFKNPAPGDFGFQWSAVDENWKSWDLEGYLKGLQHPLAVDGFEKDMNALRSCDVCVLVLPSGRSAHLEAGYAIGGGKGLIILIPAGSPIEPELMYSMADKVCNSIDDVIHMLAVGYFTGDES